MVRVAANGTGDYAKVQDAIDSVPLNNCARTTILIFPGVYREPVYIPKTKNLITFRGILPETTIISWDNTHARINHHQVFQFSLSSFTLESCYFFCLSYVLDKCLILET